MTINNYLECLPDELIEKIYSYIHKYNLKKLHNNLFHELKKMPIWSKSVKNTIFGNKLIEVTNLLHNRLCFFLLYKNLWYDTELIGDQEHDMFFNLTILHLFSMDNQPKSFIMDALNMLSFQELIYIKYFIIKHECKTF